MLAVNSRVMESIQCSPFEALLGYTPKQPHEVAVPVYRVDAMKEGWKQPGKDDLRQRIEMMQLRREGIDAVRAAKFPKQHGVRQVVFSPGQRVWLRNTPLFKQHGRKLDVHWLGPYRVLRRLSAQRHEIDRKSRGLDVDEVHVDRLKAVVEKT